MKYALLAIALAVTLAAEAPTTAVAQAMPGRPIGSSYGLEVTATAPVAVSCPNAPGCFRIFFRIVGDPGSMTAVAFAGRLTLSDMQTGKMVDTNAFMTNGAVCNGRALGGLPRAAMDIFDDPSFTNVQPYIVTADKPATLIAEFDCDEPVQRGNAVTVQLTLAVLSRGLPIKQLSGGYIARWGFDGLPLN
jgi:hypothetical protein